jgi:hypothetical protein
MLAREVLFADRSEAGRRLADRLLHLKDQRPVVLALPSHCSAPSPMVRACQRYFPEARPQSPARAGADLIAEGVVLIADARQDAPKLVELCRQGNPHNGDGISTYILGRCVNRRGSSGRLALSRLSRRSTSRRS